jgi:hypothetical protein
MPDITGGAGPNTGLRSGSGGAPPGGAGAFSSLAVTGSTTLAGASFGSVNGSTNLDLSKHIALYGTNIGLNVTGSSTINFVAGGASPVLTLSAAASVFAINARFNGNVGFYNTAPAAKQTVSGAKGSNVALGSLMTALVAMGLVTDTTSA